ncbi:MAG: hypothetical protein ACKPKO_47820 [Candidatus Fonsibacter sp.]
MEKEALAYMCPAVFVIEIGEMLFYQGSAAIYAIGTRRPDCLVTLLGANGFFFILGWRVDISGAP